MQTQSRAAEAPGGPRQGLAVPNTQQMGGTAR